MVHGSRFMVHGSRFKKEKNSPILKFLIKIRINGYENVYAVEIAPAK